MPDARCTRGWWQPLSEPPPVSDCPTRYRPAAAKELVAGVGGQAIDTRGHSFTRIAGTNRYILRSAYAAGQARSEVRINRQRVQVSARPAAAGTRDGTATFDRNLAMTGNTL